MKYYLSLLLLVVLLGCKSKQAETNAVPVIGFADAFEDNTLIQAKNGFVDALAKNGYSEKDNTVKILYKNAQGNIPTLTQIMQYFNTQKVNLVATCPSISTITAVQNIKHIPVFMMVSPEPALMKLNNSVDQEPKNLFGTGENLNYIDTSFSLIPQIIKPKGDRLKVGMIFNQSEPQSVDALNKIKGIAASLNIDLQFLPVNSSADVQLVSKSLLSKGIDAFFANPDNTVFASFETIVQTCEESHVPIFTSEAGLVSRGAVAAYGADIYQWGYQTGLQAASYLKSKSTEGLHWEMVKTHTRIYNKAVAAKYHLNFSAQYQPM